MAFFRYPGGKKKLRNFIAPKLIELSRGTTFQYREPFFGGGSIGFCLFGETKRAKDIWINDLDIGMACLWTCVIRYPNEIRDKLPSFVPSVDKFYEIKEYLLNVKTMPTTPEDIIQVGFDKLCIHQISYSGLGTRAGGPIGGEKQSSEYSVDCRWSTDYLRRKIMRFHRYFSSVKIHDGKCTAVDFEELIKDESCYSVMYLDPPYFVKGYELYQHAFIYDDHVRLSELLKSTKHAWVLSYDDCPEVRELYRWAVVETTDVHYSITALKNECGKRIARTKPELLIYAK